MEKITQNKKGILSLLPIEVRKRPQYLLIFICIPMKKNDSKYWRLYLNCVK